MNSSTEKFEPVWVAGFMSGTSLDAVDAALICTDGQRVLEFGPVVERKYESAERALLQEATQAARDWNWIGPQPEALFEAVRQLMVSCHTDAWSQLIAKAPQIQIELVGVHGQTVLHRRPKAGQRGATLQLMDGPGLARKIGRTVAYDFRTADVKAGGEGAPLAPVYHKALLNRLGGEPAVVINLGGVANITAQLSDGSLIAFDTGPANGPIDEWVEGHGRGTHDEGGQFAVSGRVHEGLLASLFEHPWFNAPPPKSLDRYDFSASLARGLSFEDGAATLTAFSAQAVAAGIAQLPEYPSRAIACGGGRHNPVLIAFLREALDCPVMLAEEVGWRGDSIEAEAFALLAIRALRGLPISWPMTTGVAEPLFGGVIARP